MLNPSVSAVATRFLALLNESPNPNLEMHAASARLQEAGLTQYDPPAKVKPAEFVSVVIEDNPVMTAQIRDLRTAFDPAKVESVEEMVSLLLPADGDLQ
jgi:hypothetical protein